MYDATRQNAMRICIETAHVHDAPSSRSSASYPNLSNERINAGLYSLKSIILGSYAADALCVIDEWPIYNEKWTSCDKG